MILTGLARLGRDVEVRYTQQGDPVASLALAFNYGPKGSDGNRQTQWVDASLFGKRAEALAPYLTKGTAVSVVLEDPHVRTYQKSDGSVGSALSARVAMIEFAGGGEKREQAPAPKPAPKPAQSTGTSFDDMDDDFPPF